jgi:ketosteroid isomerase-like protein
MKYLPYLYLIVYQLISLGAFAQSSNKASYLKEINRDIWVPFIEAYASGNAEKYLALHSKDFIRGTGNDEKLTDLSGYSVSVKQMFKNLQESGAKVKIDFRFLKRMANAQSGFEVGIYQFTAINAKGESQYYYGKFTVVSRKENGTWKILVDYDSDEEGIIDAESFKKGYPMDDYSK